MTQLNALILKKDSNNRLYRGMKCFKEGLVLDIKSIADKEYGSLDIYGKVMSENDLNVYNTNLSFDLKKNELIYTECNCVDFEDRDIVLNNPTEEELGKWIKLSGLEIKKFFNTSGVLYREMNLKDKLKDMSQEEMIKLLASDGKLVKRPLLITEEKVLVGFKEETYKEII